VAMEPLTQDGTTTVLVKLSENVNIPISIVISTTRSSAEQVQDKDLEEAQKLFRDGPELPEGAAEEIEAQARIKENSKKKKRNKKQ